MTPITFFGYKLGALTWWNLGSVNKWCHLNFRLFWPPPPTPQSPCVTFLRPPPHMVTSTSPFLVDPLKIVKRSPNFRARAEENCLKSVEKVWSYKMYFCARSVSTTVNFLNKQEFYQNSTVIQIEFLNIGRNICLCYSRHLIFTGIQNYRNSVYRNSPEFTNSCLSDKIHRGMCLAQFDKMWRQAQPAIFFDLPP